MRLQVKRQREDTRTVNEKHHQKKTTESAQNGGHHAKMAADFKRRFWVSLVLTVPVLVLSPMIQELLGVARALDFAGDRYVQFAFASGIFAYGGWPFSKGLLRELRDKNPGMMTLIALAVVTAYVFTTEGLRRFDVLAASLLVAGGVGNLIDRAAFAGRVTDFVTVGVGRLRTGIFNVADVLIVAGVGWFVFSLIAYGPERGDTPGDTPG